MPSLSTLSPVSKAANYVHMGGGEEEGVLGATERYGRRRRGPLRKSGEKEHVRFTKRVIEVPETSKKNGA